MKKRAIAMLMAICCTAVGVPCMSASAEYTVVEGLKKDTLEYRDEVVENICNNYEVHSDNFDFVLKNCIGYNVYEINPDTSELAFKDYFEVEDPVDAVPICLFDSNIEADYDYVVTGIFYKKGETEPAMYSVQYLDRLNSEEEFILEYSAVKDYLGDDTLQVGDVLYLNKWPNHVGHITSLTVNRQFPIEPEELAHLREQDPEGIARSEAAYAKSIEEGIAEGRLFDGYVKLGNGEEVFGEGFDKVMRKMLERPLPTRWSGAFYGIDLSEYTADYSGFAVTRGDISDDGNISVIDVLSLNRSLMGVDTLNRAQSAAADVNQDGVADATDSLNILKHVVGLIDNFDELNA